MTMPPLATGRWGAVVDAVTPGFSRIAQAPAPPARWCCGLRLASSQPVDLGHRPRRVADVAGRGRTSRLVRLCSRMCADQPAVRAQVNIGP